MEKGLHLSHLALRKGVRWQFLARHNQLKEPYRLKRGQILQINNTHIVPTETIHGLVINLPELALYHFQEGAFRRRYSLDVGRRTWPTPTGNYEIRNKARNPTWIVPASIQEEMAEAGKEVLERVPPGPDNPLGAFWLGTSAPGVGLHATNRPWSIGTSASHGCIRMLPDEIAELLFGLDPKVWAEIYQLLDLPIIACVVILTGQVRRLVPERFWPVLPVAIVMAIALIIPSSFPLTVWNYWRRVLAYGAGAALAYNCRKIWLNPIPGREAILDDGTQAGRP